MKNGTFDNDSHFNKLMEVETLMFSVFKLADGLQSARKHLGDEHYSLCAEGALGCIAHAIGAAKSTMTEINIDFLFACANVE